MGPLEPQPEDVLRHGGLLGREDAGELALADPDPRRDVAGPQRRVGQVAFDDAAGRFIVAAAGGQGGTDRVRPLRRP